MPFEACAFSASSSIGGKLLSLLLARSRTPWHAFSLKKYLAGTCWVSKASDKKDTTASLGHSEELRVKNSPCQTVPELIQLSEKASEVSPPRAAERARDVFPDKPTWADFIHSPYVLKHESGSPAQAAAVACN